VALPPQKPGAEPGGAQDASGRRRNAGDELLEVCSALEDEVEELKAKYEMYFLGVEQREPNKWREETRKKVLRLKEQFTRNTGLRFRIQSLHARFISYERLWMRSAREREEGTYRRDLFKAKLHQRGGPVAGQAAGQGVATGVAKGAARPGGALPKDGEDVDLSDFSALGDEAPAAARSAAGPTAPPGAAKVAAKPAAATRPAAAAAPAAPAAPARPAAAPPPPAAAPGAAPPPAARLGEKQMRELYDAYVQAKKRCGEDTSRLTYDAVSSTVSKQIPEIMKQHKARSVEFKVVIKDGKAKLTAVPKS